MRNYRSAVFAMVASFAGGACASPDSESALPTWTVASTPAVRIGDDADPRTQFADIISARRLPQGAIAVADRGSQEVRLFSNAGAFLKLLTRKGRGPGEFEGKPGPLLRSRDTLFMAEYPPGPRQIHLFDVQAGFLGRVPIVAVNASGSAIRVEGRLSAGGYLVSAAPRFANLDPTLRPGDLMRDSVMIGVIGSAAATSITWIGTFPSTTRIAVEPVPGAPVAVPPAPWGASTYRAASDTLIWIGDSGSGIITIFDVNGRRIREFTFPLPTHVIADSAMNSARQAAISEVTTDPQRATVMAQYSRPAVPERSPFFSGLLAGIDDEMWVQEFSENAKAHRRYIVLDRNGGVAARVTMPVSRFRLTDVGHDYVLGVESDDDGVDRVVEYTFRRP